MMNNELCLPADAVSAAGEGEGAPGVAPGVGDEVTVEVMGTVSRVEGGNVYVTAKTANGQPIPEMGGAGPEPDTDDMMRGMAEQEDASRGGYHV